MVGCYAHHLATTYQGQGLKFGKKSTFSECGHVAYQIKGNEMYDNIYAHILTLRTPSIPEVGSKGQDHKLGEKSTFSECGRVAYQIKGNETYDNIQTNCMIYANP